VIFTHKDIWYRKFRR